MYLNKHSEKEDKPWPLHGLMHTAEYYYSNDKY
jgi:hypothetical protein